MLVVECEVQALDEVVVGVGDAEVGCGELGRPNGRSCGDAFCGVSEILARK
jgi:hypothetical protein